MNNLLELYGVPTGSLGPGDWRELVDQQQCPYLGRTCLKTRKSDPEASIGTCSVLYGRSQKKIVICPHRFLERRQVFVDCIHLLTLHEPGNELHICQEVAIPGGSVDYFLVSARNSKVRDFVGIELQSLDTTGTVWPHRQRFLAEHGLLNAEAKLPASKPFGMNWKMTAKTTLIQLHHKVETFEHINKHLVLVIQNHFLDYMRRAFRFSKLADARLGDSAQFHAYQLAGEADGNLRIQLISRLSTNSDGIAESLGLKASQRVELDEIVRSLEARISEKTLLSFDVRE